MEENRKTAYATAHMLRKLIDSAEKALEWGDIYDFVFSENVSAVIFATFPDFDWSDPDASYDDDVKAFANAFFEYVDKHFPITQQNQ